MTTNKPEVVAWLHAIRQDSDVITDKVRHVWGAPLGSMGEYTVALIRLTDYERLQADYERLQADHEAALAADNARIAELEGLLLQVHTAQKLHYGDGMGLHLEMIGLAQRIDAALSQQAKP